MKLSTFGCYSAHSHRNMHSIHEPIIWATYSNQGRGAAGAYTATHGAKGRDTPWRGGLSVMGQTNAFTPKGSLTSPVCLTCLWTVRWNWGVDAGSTQKGLWLSWPGIESGTFSVWGDEWDFEFTAFTLMTSLVVHAGRMCSKCRMRSNTPYEWGNWRPLVFLPF